MTIPEILLSRTITGYHLSREPFGLRMRAPWAAVRDPRSSLARTGRSTSWRLYFRPLTGFPTPLRRGPRRIYFAVRLPPDRIALAFRMKPDI